MQSHKSETSWNTFCGSVPEDPVSWEWPGPTLAPSPGPYRPAPHPSSKDGKRPLPVFTSTEIVPWSLGTTENEDSFKNSRWSQRAESGGGALRRLGGLRGHASARGGRGAGQGRTPAPRAPVETALRRFLPEVTSSCNAVTRVRKPVGWPQSHWEGDGVAVSGAGGPHGCSDGESSGLLAPGKIQIEVSRQSQRQHRPGWSGSVASGTPVL